MKFKDWLKLQETGTSTACIAIFARPFIGIVRRTSLDGWEGGPLDEPQDKPRKRKKKKKKKS